MRTLLSLSACLVLPFASPCPAAAHPHEFIDTGITFRFDDEGRLGAIGIAWAWDELTSMMIVEDLGMDGDGDGHLTEDEKTDLAARMSQWPEDYEGDLYLRFDGTPVLLGRPLEVVADYRDGRLVVQYLRALPDRIRPDRAQVVLQAYDPGYYAHYEIAGTPEVRGRDGCRVSIRKADVPAAKKLYDQLLERLTEDEIMEQGKYPEIGGAFADEVVLECDARP